MLAAIRYEVGAQGLRLGVVLFLYIFLVVINYDYDFIVNPNIA